MTKMRMIALLFCLMLMFPANAENLATELSLFEGKLTVSLPPDFTLMTDEMNSVEYPFGNPPWLVYTDQSTRTNFIASKVPLPQLDETLDDIALSMKTRIGEVRAVKLWRKGQIKVINGKSVGYLEFVTPVLESDDYDLENHLYLIRIDASLILLGANCMTNSAIGCRALTKSLEQTIKVVD